MSGWVIICDAKNLNSEYRLFIDYEFLTYRVIHFNYI